MENKKFGLSVRNVAVFILSCAFISVLHSTHTFAAPTATLTLNPTTTAVTQGSSTTLTIQVVAGTNKITAAQACIIYDSTKLEWINTDVTGTPLTNFLPADPTTDCPTGQKSVGRYGTPPYPSGTFILAKMTFKALVANTTSPITINNAKSFIYDDTSSALNLLVAPAGASTITLNPIPAAPPSSNPSTPAPNTTNVPALTDTNRNTKSTSTTQATSSDVQAPLPTTQKPVVTSAVTAKKQSKTNKYLIDGAIVVGLIALMGGARFGYMKVRKNKIYKSTHIQPVEGVVTDHSAIPQPPVVATNQQPSTVITPTTHVNEQPTHDTQDVDQTKN